MSKMDLVDFAYTLRRTDDNSNSYINSLYFEEITGIDRLVFCQFLKDECDFVKCIYCKNIWIDYGEQICPECGASFEYELER